MRWLLIAVFLFPILVLAESNCPSSFDEFLVSFEIDREFQQQHMIYPLKHSFVESGARPVPGTVNELLSSPDVLALKKPIYPTPRDQKAAFLVREFRGQSLTEKTIRLYKPDTGYVLEYHFEKIDGCWKLAKFDDYSI